ncbi:MAG: 8-oxoguanine deaminase [Fidelibacterota bacterium]|nr:MAG: 8-oxoguanine deaminase [Candidatus Neomarinimicrobiota bacterium]
MTKRGSILIQQPLYVATMDEDQREFGGGHIFIEEGMIQSVGPEPLDRPADTVVDASNAVVLPGFVNTHHHLFQTLTRNIPKMQEAPLFDWLTNHYELWRELTEEGVYTSALTGLLELMKSGVSTSSDHLYLFPAQAGTRLIDAEIRAAQELGIRFHPTRGSMSLGKSKGGLPPDDLVQTEDKIQEDTERLVKAYHDPSPGGMVRLALAPCSPFSVTPELMRLSAKYAQENLLQLHTHLAETIDEEQFCLTTFGQRPAEYVESFGWVKEYSWFAHSIHLNDIEIASLGSAEAGISHCPSSNMRLGSGIARIKELLHAGAKVSLAVDGSASNDSSNMLAEIRNAVLLSRLRDGSKWLTAREALHMATTGGAEVLGRDDIGRLAPGMRADVALFSLDGIEYAGARSDPLAALVFTVRMKPVDFLIIDGIFRVQQGDVRFDEESLIRKHNRLSQDMLERAYDRTGIDFSMPSARDKLATE